MTTGRRRSIPANMSSAVPLLEEAVFTNAQVSAVCMLLNEFSPMSMSTLRKAAFYATILFGQVCGKVFVLWQWLN